MKIWVTNRSRLTLVCRAGDTPAERQLS